MSLGAQAPHKCFELEMPLSTCLTPAPSFALLLLHSINIVKVRGGTQACSSTAYASLVHKCLYHHPEVHICENNTSFSHQ